MALRVIALPSLSAEQFQSRAAVSCASSFMKTWTTITRRPVYGPRDAVATLHGHLPERTLKMLYVGLAQVFQAVSFDQTDDPLEARGFRPTTPTDQPARHR
jgi:hypothetical protein